MGFRSEVKGSLGGAAEASASGGETGAAIEVKSCLGPCLLASNEHTTEKLLCFFFITLFVPIFYFSQKVMARFFLISVLTNIVFALMHTSRTKLYVAGSALFDIYSSC